MCLYSYYVLLNTEYTFCYTGFMSKRLLLVALGILILVLVVLAAVFLLPKVIKQKNGQNGQKAGEVSIAGLINGAKNQSCDYSFKLAEGEGVGITYVGDGKLRNDLKITYASGNSFEEHAIIDGQTVYLWNSMSKNGSKMAIDLSKDAPTKTGLDRLITPKCASWKGEASKFVLPSGMEFTEVTIGKPFTTAVAPLAATESAPLASPLASPLGSPQPGSPLPSAK